MSDTTNVFGLTYISKDKGGHIGTPFISKGKPVSVTDRLVSELTKMEDLTGVQLSEVKLVSFIDSKMKGLSAILVAHAESQGINDGALRLFINEAKAVIPDDDDPSGVNPLSSIVSMAAKCAARLDPDGFSLDAVIAHLQENEERFNRSVAKIRANGKDDDGAWIISKPRQQ